MNKEKNIKECCFDLRYNAKLSFLGMFLLWLFIAAPCNAAVVVDHDFNDMTYGPLGHASFWSIQSTGGVGNTPAARLTYSQAGTAGKEMIAYVSSYESNTFWVELDVKIQGTMSGGSKFVKFFGEDAAGSTKHVNNMTLGLEYSSNTNNRVSYYGDTVCADPWSGPPQYGNCGSQWLTTGSKIDPRGGTWGHYKAYIKRADSGLKNGVTKVWWNGNLVAHIVGQDSNPTSFGISEGFKQVQFGGYNHAENFSGTTYYMWMDNIYVGTTEKNAAPIPGPTLSNPQPTSALSTGTTSTTMSVSTNVAATCKYSTTAGTAYSSMSNTMTGGGTTSHSVLVSGLTNGSSTTYYLRCAKASDGEVTTVDFPITVSVSNTQYSLIATKTGTGSGTLTSSPSGLNCGSVCAYDFNENSSVIVTATPDSNSTFFAWGGGCTSINGNQCTVTMNAAKNITATFSSNIATCDADHYWACSDGPCQAQGFHFWEGACRTIPVPTDWTGENIAVNGTFTNWTDNLPDSWGSYTTGRVAEDLGACGLYANTSSAHVYRKLPEIKTYRYAINVRNMTDSLEIWTEAESSAFHNATDGSSRTVTGLVSYMGEGDTNVYFQAPGGGTKTAVIDDVVLKELLPATSFRSDVDGSSQISTTDALLTLRNSLGLSMNGTAWQPTATTGDVNCDGVSNSTDALLILRHSLGLSMSGTGWCEGS